MIIKETWERKIWKVSTPIYVYPNPLEPIIIDLFFSKESQPQ